jgi:hypothetical protein
MLEELFGKPSDRHILGKAYLAEYAATCENDWDIALDHLKRAKKHYSMLSEGRSEKLVGHARRVLDMEYPMNRTQVIGKFDYAKRIFIKQESDVGLYLLAGKAEDAVSRFSLDGSKSMMLGYALDIYGRLKNYDMMTHIGQEALKQIPRFPNPLSEERFLRLAIKAYRMAGEKDVAAALRTRHKHVNAYLLGCAIHEITPRHSARP